MVKYLESCMRFECHQHLFRRKEKHRQKNMKEDT